MVTCLEMLKQSKRYNGQHVTSSQYNVGENRPTSKELLANPYLRGLHACTADVAYGNNQSASPRLLSNRFHRLNLRASIPTPGERSLREEWRKNSGKSRKTAEEEEKFRIETETRQPARIRIPTPLEGAKLHRRNSPPKQQQQPSFTKPTTPRPQSVKRILPKTPSSGRVLPIPLYETPRAPSNSPRSSISKSELKPKSYSQKIAQKNRFAMRPPRTAHGSREETAENAGRSLISLTTAEREERAVILKRSGMVNPRMAASGARYFRSASRRPPPAAIERPNQVDLLTSSSSLPRQNKLRHPSQHAVKAAKQLGIKLNESDQSAAAMNCNSIQLKRTVGALCGVSESYPPAARESYYAWENLALSARNNYFDGGKCYSSLDSSILKQQTVDPVLNCRILLWLKDVESNPNLYYGFETDLIASEIVDKKKTALE